MYPSALKQKYSTNILISKGKVVMKYTGHEARLKDIVGQGTKTRRNDLRNNSMF